MPAHEKEKSQSDNIYFYASFVNEHAANISARTISHKLQSKRME